MKWYKRDLDNLEFNTFNCEEDIDLSNEIFPASLNLKSLKDIKVKYECYYDSYSEILNLKAFISGIMVIPCARTNELIDYKFNIEEQVNYSFVENSNEDDIIINGNIIDTFEFIRDCIITSVPIALYKEGSKPIVNNNSNEQINSQFAKLKNLIK